MLQVPYLVVMHRFLTVKHNMYMYSVCLPDVVVSLCFKDGLDLRRGEIATD